MSAEHKLAFLEKSLHCIQSTFNLLRMIHDGRWLCPGKRIRPPPYFPTYCAFTVPSHTPAAMSTDQRVSERLGELVQDAFEALLRANTNLERLQDLIGLGMDPKELLTPHSQATWKFLVPQEQRFRENWNKFISAMEGVKSSVNHPQQAAVETVEPAPTPLPAVTAQATGETLPRTQDEV